MDTRTALLNSAEAACRQHGFDGFSYADMAREVGIAKPSIHHHFPQKADLALALIERYHDEFFTALSAISASGQSAGIKVADYVQLHRNALKGGTCVCLSVALGMGRMSLSDAVTAKLDRFFASSINWLEAVFQEGCQDHSITEVTEPRLEAIATFALMQGAQLVAKGEANLQRFDDAVATLLARCVT